GLAARAAGVPMIDRRLGAMERHPISSAQAGPASALRAALGAARGIIGRDLAPRGRAIWVCALCAGVLVTAVACELADWQRDTRPVVAAPVLSEPEMRVRVRRDLPHTEITGPRRILAAAGSERALLATPVMVRPH